MHLLYDIHRRIVFPRFFFHFFIFLLFVRMYVCLVISFSDQGPASAVIAMFVWSREYGTRGCTFDILDMGNSISGCRHLIRFMVQHTDPKSRGVVI